MSLATSTSVPTLLFAAFAAVALAGCGVNVSLGGDATVRTDEQTLPATGIDTLDVTTDNGAVEVRVGGIDEITIETIRREEHDGDAESSIEVDGDRVVVTGDCDSRWWDTCSVGFVITVPSETDVDVTTSNGRVEASGVDGDVTIETDNGAIEATALGGGHVVASTDNGRIRLTFDDAPGSVSAHTDNGSISIRLPDDGNRYSVDADNDNGTVDVDVDTDREAERHVVARSDNGSIDIGYRTT